MHEGIEALTSASYSLDVPSKHNTRERAFFSSRGCAITDAKGQKTRAPGLRGESTATEGIQQE